MKEHRLIGALALTLLLLCITGIATAQTATRVTPCNAATPNNALCVTWTGITTATDGSAITGVTYRVERGTSATGTYSTVQASGTAAQYYATNLSTGTHYFRVYANCSGCTAESAASNTASAPATPIPVIPSTPVIIIAAVIRADGPPTYRIIQSVTLKPNEVVFAAPASMRSLFASK